MNPLALLILLIGIICIVIGYSQAQQQCPPPKIEYRYIPRTFYEQQLSIPTVNRTFSSMFENQSPWDVYPQGVQEPIYSLNSKKKKKRKLENYFTV